MEVIHAERVRSGLASIAFKVGKDKTQTYDKDTYKQFVQQCLQDLGYYVSGKKTSFTAKTTLNELSAIAKKSCFIWNEMDGLKAGSYRQEFVIEFQPSNSSPRQMTTLITSLDEKANELVKAAGTRRILASMLGNQRISSPSSSGSRGQRNRQSPVKNRLWTSRNGLRESLSNVNGGSSPTYFVSPVTPPLCNYDGSWV